MVYKFFNDFTQNLPKYLQPSCLLCQCSISADGHETTESRIFGLCHYCEASLPYIEHSCRSCAIPLEAQADYCGQCLQKTPLFTSAHCAVRYQGDIPKLVHQLKHQHDKATNRLLADLFIQSLPERLPNVDLIIPVPMHTKRNLQRGNNQSILLSRCISRKLKIKHNNKLLQRQHLTPTQQGLSAKERRGNLKNAFVTCKPINGLHIAVIDDVITTGSTMNEIAKTLKQAGANEVYAWAVARTPKYYS